MKLFIIKQEIIMRKKLNESEKKMKLSISIEKTLIDIIEQNISNKSKYIEKLIREDLIKNNKINVNSFK